VIGDFYVALCGEFLSPTSYIPHIVLRQTDWFRDCGFVAVGITLSHNPANRHEGLLKMWGVWCKVVNANIVVHIATSFPFEGTRWNEGNGRRF
jgi:hypothetical protein